MKPTLLFLAALLGLSLLAAADDAAQVSKAPGASVEPSDTPQTPDMSIYDVKITAQDGSETTLAPYRGKVLLIVNTATRCGYTPQYKDLQELYDRCRERGLEILDFPCNQFGAQAPGSNEEIHSFCTLRFGTQFPRFAKIDVNGPNAAPLYQLLTRDSGRIRWNFTKFLIDREGRIVARFEPADSMEKVAAQVEALL